MPMRAGAEAKAMHAARREHDIGGRHQRETRAIQRHLGMACANDKYLNPAFMPVGRDFPVMQAGTLGNRFDVGKTGG